MSYRLFISHAWKYGKDYENLINLLNEKLYFIPVDYSLPEDDPLEDVNSQTDIKKGLKNHIRPVNAFIVIAGMYFNYSKWMRFEVEYAKELEKPIIVVKPRGNERIPSFLEMNATIIVGWNKDSIVNAIRNYSV